MDENFTITQLADEFQVTPRAIRFYEDKGLLQPGRQGLRRIYSRRDRGRLRLILRGKRLGFSLAEIQEMLDLYDLGDGQAEQLRVTRRAVLRRINQMEMQRRELSEAIGELRDAAGAIDRALALKNVTGKVA